MGRTQTLPSIADWASVFRSWLGEGDLAEVRHAFIRISDDLKPLDGASASALCEVHPEATGSDGVDAALAPLVEFTLKGRGLDPPSWAASVPPAPEPFYLVVNVGLRGLVVDETPQEFSERNLFVPAAYFESV